MMNWEEVKDISDAGFPIGAHGRTHGPLFGMDKRKEENEICGSIKDISRHTS